jgi:hypothetical protein
MRASLCTVAFALVACAQQPHQPPPPTQPSIQGKVNSVSAADIRLVLQLKRKDMIGNQGSKLPIYVVRVVDQNHIQLQYWSGAAETWAFAERVKGKWKLAEFERVIVKASEIPTS